MSRVALVTGGTRGLGEAICIALKEAGYKVVANYAHDDDRAKKFTKKTGIKTYKWDVASDKDCHEAVEKIEKEVGPVDILVNNAGITRDAMLHKMHPDDWELVLKTNLSSCFYMCHAVINKMRDKKFGRIINISSINGLAGQMGQTNYSAAKAGMIGFSKALARESAIKNITVNVIAPGYTNTDMIKGVPEKVMEKIVAQIPVGRVGEPTDIARCVLFLASDDAGFITGETISVNGGHYMN